MFIAEYFAAAFVQEKESQFRSQRFAQRTAFLLQRKQQTKGSR